MDTNRSEKSTKVYKKSDVIFEEGSKGNEMYIIRSGKIRLVLGGEKEKGAVCTLEKPGEVFGEMALIDVSPRAATAIALEDNTELEVLDRDNFLKKIREDPEFALDLMRTLSERVRVGNVLYLEVIRRAMAPYCRNNCLQKTMDAFVRRTMSRAAGQAPSAEVVEMHRWRCTPCDYIYLPEYGDSRAGISSGTPFEKLPDNWTCPECGASKEEFKKIES